MMMNLLGPRDGLDRVGHGLGSGGLSRGGADHLNPVERAAVPDGLEPPLPFDAVGMDAGAVRSSQVLGRREVADQESLGGAGQGRVDRHAGGIQHLGQPIQSLAVAAEGDPARAARLQHALRRRQQDVLHGNAPHPAGLIAAQPVQVQPPLPDQLVVHPAGHSAPASRRTGAGPPGQCPKLAKASRASPLTAAITSEASGRALSER